MIEITKLISFKNIFLSIYRQNMALLYRFLRLNDQVIMKT